MINEMNFKNDERIINEVIKVLNINYESHKYFNDGACSRVILLNNKYLIKQNNPTLLKGEVEFLRLNKQEILQKIIYVNSKYEYAVYDFIEGNTMKRVINVDDTINKLVRFVNSYKEYNEGSYGYFEEQVNSWNDFLLDEVNSSSKNIKDYIPSSSLVIECVNELKKYPFNKKLLHGDFGTHNFIERNNKLVGIIDPEPVLGDSLYDLLFAFVSNVDILKNITLERLDDILNEDSKKIYAMLTIVLYSRISRCLKYHKEDIDIYMNYWKYLENKKSNYFI